MDSRLTEQSLEGDGRSLTSRRSVTRDDYLDKITDLAEDAHKDGRYMPNLLDAAYLAARAQAKARIPAVFTQPQAIDSATFVGRGASFSVYRREILAQKQTKPEVNMGSWTATMGDDGPAVPEAIAYKVPMIELTDTAEAKESSRAALRSTVNELYVLTRAGLTENPNIISLLGLAWDSNIFSGAHQTPVIILEYSHMGTLHHLQKKTLLPLGVRRKLCLDVCNGLEALHAHAIVHGDVKSENILVFGTLPDQLTAKISDFGHSVLMGDGCKEYYLAGTRTWQAPEATEPVPAELAESTDVYSLGLLIWRTLAHGQNIFENLCPEVSPQTLWYDSVNRLKASGDLVSRTATEHWYQRSLAAAPTMDIDALSHLLHGFDVQSLTAAGDNSSASAILASECMLMTLKSSPAASALAAPLESLLNKDSVFIASLHAIKIAISVDPKERSLPAVKSALEGKAEESVAGKACKRETPLLAQPLKHQYSWQIWPQLLPTLQTYLARAFVNREKSDARLSQINPPESFLLSALHINGYGLHKDEDQATKSMGKSSRGDMTIALAYAYRFAIACGFSFDPPTTARVKDKLMFVALQGSRSALQDLATLDPSMYQKAREHLRQNLAGIGADFYFQSEMFQNNLPTFLQLFDNIDLMKQVWAKARNLKTMKVNKRGDGLLHLAAATGKINALQTLLQDFGEQVDDINQINMQGETPLLCACRSGHVDTTLWLLDRGANACIAANNGEAPLHWLISFDQPDVALVGTKLVQHGARIDHETVEDINHSEFPGSISIDRLKAGSAVFWACQVQRDDIVKFLLDRPEAQGEHKGLGSVSRNPLILSACYHNHKCLKPLIDFARMRDISLKADEKHKHIVQSSCAMIEAAVTGADKFEMILRHGKDWKSHMVSTVELLLPFTANSAPAGGYGSPGQTLLFYSIVMLRDDVTELLIRKGWDLIQSSTQFDVERYERSESIGAYRPSHLNLACGPDQRTPVLEALRLNRVNVYNLLVQSGADPLVSCRNPFSGAANEWNALHVFAQAGHDSVSSIVEDLVRRGVPLDGNEVGSMDQVSVEPPLLVAIQLQSFKLASHLLELGAQPSRLSKSSGLLTLEFPMTVLGHIVVTNSRFALRQLAYLLPKLQGNSSDHFIVEPERRLSVLHCVAKGALGLSFRATDIEASRPLFWNDIDWAANFEIFNELLHHFNLSTEELNCQDKGGLTPLHWAIRAGNEAVVQSLLDRTLSATDISDRRKTCIDLAKEMLPNPKERGNNISSSSRETAARERIMKLLDTKHSA